ncbi:MAG: GNAT family N-acetyltransferase, partial [Candidatus Micrarchaeia archaeon]
CPYTIIPKSIEVIPKMLKHKSWKNLRRNLRNLEKNFKKVELVDYKQFKSVDDAMNAFFMLHQKRWLLKNKPGVFETDTVKNFFLDVARIFAEKGFLALYFLMVDDRPIATQLCYEYAQKLYYVLGGFDPEFYQYSPGNIITFKILGKYAGSSLREYDFLKGGEPYKFEWTRKYRRNFNFRFVNRQKILSTMLDFGIKTIKKTRIDVTLGKLLRF